MVGAMAARRTPALLEGCGIELEYAIVDRDSLNVLSLSDEVLRAAAGHYTNEYRNDRMGWSNEFVCHVIELKNNDPLPSLKGLATSFHQQIKEVHTLLRRMGGRLMPTGMHPWMDPRKEAKIWQHRYRQIYETYDRIFNCRRHGWANVQSMHVNLSFREDEEFGRLHAAIRLILPIIPALAASSPIVSGKVTGLHDTRLLYYSRNQQKVPSVMGRIIPEPVFTEAEYRKKILESMYRAIAPYDEEGILQHEWLNSRGAIPRYERKAMEIRVIDTQECPRANIAVAELIIAALRLLVAGQWGPYDVQKGWGISPLVSVFRKCIRGSDTAVIENTRYLRMLGFPESKAQAGEVWKHLLTEGNKGGYISRESMKILDMITEKGTLSRRILRAVGPDPSHSRLKSVYQRLCECLEMNRPFIE